MRKIPTISMDPRAYYVLPNWSWVELRAKDPKAGPQRSWTHKRKSGGTSDKSAGKGSKREEILNKILKSI